MCSSDQVGARAAPTMGWKGSPTITRHSTGGASQPDTVRRMHRSAGRRSRNGRQTNSTLGGNDVTLTATLTEPHSPFGADISLLSNASLIPSLCAGGRLAADATTLSFDRPTAVVTAPTDVPLSLLIGYIPDPTTGKGRTLASTPRVLTLNPGGVELPPVVSSFTLTPSTIPAGQGSSIALTMTRASASTTPNQITVTSSNPSVAFSNEQPGPTVPPGCTTASGTIWSANSVPDTTDVTISASTQGQVPVTNVLTVTATPLKLAGFTFNPTSAVSGGSSVVTITVNKPAPAGGFEIFLSGTPGISTGASLIVPPSVTIPEGQTSASFTATVPALSHPAPYRTQNLSRGHWALPRRAWGRCWTASRKNHYPRLSQWVFNSLGELS